MCGITGVYAYGRAGDGGRPSAEVIAKMTRTLAHRGPDQEGTWQSERHPVALGFRRLAIVDLSPAGHQPMSNGDGTLKIVFNGEIYNHESLRPFLEARGHRFRGRSDTETLVRLYQELGPDCLTRLNGMFAFAVWDDRTGEIFLARDRLGIKPLYYTVQDGRLIFGSEIKAILAHPGVERDIDPDALAHYLTFLVSPPPATLFKGIQKLPAGHFLRLGPDGNARVEQYWDAIPPASPPARSFDECAEELRTRFSESVRGMLMSDIPYGVFLSGGVDSSANVAFVAEHSGMPVNTFSVGFHRYEQFNELHHARAVAEHFGTKHEEVRVSDRDALDCLPALLDSQDEPLADWVCIPLYFVSQLARESGVAVVHIGEGSDEIFSGYPSYILRLRLQRWWPLLRTVPKSAWNAVAAGSRSAARAGFRPADRFGRLLGYVSQEDGRYWGNAIAFRGDLKAELLRGPFWQTTPIPDSGQVIAKFHDRVDAVAPGIDALQRLSYIELKQRLPELLLMRADKLTMAHAVESRVPFLDHTLVEFAMSLPQDIRIPGDKPKALLKRALEPVLPAAVLDRPKQGFGAPVEDWFRNELRDEVSDVLLRGRLHERGYFDVDVIARLLDAHQNRAQNLATPLWTLYNLFRWYDRWIAS